jgi:hypothetical protein
MSNTIMPNVTLSEPRQKASAFCSLLNKLKMLKNATAYTRDWYCRLVDGRALLAEINVAAKVVCFFLVLIALI